MALPALPLGTAADYVGPVLLASDQRLFLKLRCSRLRKQLNTEVSVFTPRSSASRRRNPSSVRSRLPAQNLDVEPPMWRQHHVVGAPMAIAVRLPVCRYRCSHLIADEKLTPNRCAAARRLMPPYSTASIHPIAQILRIWLTYPHADLPRPT
jgi:hypothetical protein